MLRFGPASLGLGGFSLGIPCPGTVGALAPICLLGRRGLDGDTVSFDWALDSSAVGISAGLAGFFGGVIAGAFGFEAVFVMVALFSAASAMVLLLVPDLVLPKPKDTDAEVPPSIKSRSQQQLH